MSGQAALVSRISRGVGILNGNGVDDITVTRRFRAGDVVFDSCKVTSQGRPVTGTRVMPISIALGVATTERVTSCGFDSAVAMVFGLGLAFDPCFEGESDFLWHLARFCVLRGVNMAAARSFSSREVAISRQLSGSKA